MKSAIYTSAKVKVFQFLHEMPSLYSPTRFLPHYSDVGYLSFYKDHKDRHPCLKLVEYPAFGYADVEVDEDNIDTNIESCRPKRIFFLNQANLVVFYPGSKFPYLFVYKPNPDVVVSLAFDSSIRNHFGKIFSKPSKHSSTEINEFDDYMLKACCELPEKDDDRESSKVVPKPDSLSIKALSKAKISSIIEDMHIVSKNDEASHCEDVFTDCLDSFGISLSESSYLVPSLTTKDTIETSMKDPSCLAYKYGQAMDALEEVFGGIGFSSAESRKPVIKNVITLISEGIPPKIAVEKLRSVFWNIEKVVR
ncbi:hypothetical protein ADUPG1_000067 [Aduncisulcus paluster]|uniref:Uncharacterized protein n=1 Tax=Aduncisulcus paluster TaxID=2918883 RepID=A0ABQ5K4M2_9EUKA|nr:hypothetical protein ADUPG1_000067 [Aduncisulcus paluster]